MKYKSRTAVARASFKHKLICVAVASAFGSTVYANPTGPAVVNGQATFVQQGGTLAITNTPNAIINWQSFSIGASEATRFIQQSASSAVLNRVIGVDPSVILGTLQSNGKVFLINPSGVLFGQGSRIDVAGLVASTLNLSNQDFLAGRLNFTAGAVTAGGISNQGTITTPSGGSVILVAPMIENSGIINAPNGDVILAAGRSVRLGDTGAPNVLVEIQAPDTQAVNVGEIVAAGGSASIYAGLIQQKGVVRADSATMDAAGRIVFKASKDVTLVAGSTTSASGATGGKVVIQAEGGTNLVYGDVSATGSVGKGGDVRLLGTQVGVAGNATVNASGASGGGSILVGGDYKGGNADVQNATFTLIAPTASLAADATAIGNGGKIIVWSDKVTGAYGAISARGGSSGGNGGFIETSSKGYLEVTSMPDLAAPRGSGGTWLIDPANIEITAATQNILTTNFGGGTLFTNDGTNSPSTLSAATINSRLSGGITVIVDTTSPLSEAGNITINAPITMTAATATTASLSLLADNSIFVNQAITATGSAVLGVSLSANQTSGTGSITANAPISTNGGNIELNGNATFFAGFDTGAGLFTGNGSLTLYNTSYTVGGNINVTGTTTLGANSTLTLNGSNRVLADLVLDPNPGGSVTISGVSGGLALAVGNLTLVNAPSTAPGVAKIDGTAVNVSGTSTVTGHILELANAGRLQTNNLVFTDAQIVTLDGSASTLVVANRFTDNGGNLFGGEASKIDLGMSGAGSFVSLTNSSFTMNLVSPIRADSVYMQTFEGSIKDGNAGALNITANSLYMSSSGGIGDSSDPIETAVTFLDAHSGSLGSSGLHINNIGDVTAYLTAQEGDISLVNKGKVTVEGNCDCFASVYTEGGAIYIESIDSNITLDGGSIRSSRNGPVDAGKITLKAAGDITSTDSGGMISADGLTGNIDGSPPFNAPGRLGGTITITAGGGINLKTVDITARGSDGANGPNDGGTGGNVVISAGGPILLGSIDVSGGNGGAGNGDTYDAGAGGWAGMVDIATSAASASIEIDSIFARGGAGGTRGTSGTGREGGQGGVVTIHSDAVGGSLALSVFGSIDVSGGVAGDSDFGADGAGGAGGNINIFTTGGELGIYAPELIAHGGDSNDEGGAGGFVFISSSSSTVQLSIPAGTSGLLSLQGIAIDVSGGEVESSGAPGNVVLQSGDGGIVQTAVLSVNTTDMYVASSGSVILDNVDNVIPGVWGNVGADLTITTFSPVQLGKGGTSGLTVGGNIVVRSESGSDFTIPGNCGEIAASCIGIPDGITAGGNIELYADGIDDHGTIKSGQLDSNYVRFAPATPGSPQDLSLIDVSNYVTPHVQLGNPDGVADGTTWGHITVSTSAVPSNFNPAVKSFEIYAGSVDIDGNLGLLDCCGPGTPLPISFTVVAGGAINVGTNVDRAIFTTIYLADGSSLRLEAGKASGGGDLTIGGDSGIGLVVGIPGGNTVNPGSMTLSGTNIIFQSSGIPNPGGPNGTYVAVNGLGNQTITAQDSVQLVHTSGPAIWVQVQDGLQTVTTTNSAGAGLLVSSLDATAGQASLSTTGGLGTQSINIAGDILVQSGIGSDNVAEIRASNGQSITANSIRIVGAEGGHYAEIRSNGGVQEITTNGNGGTGWGIELQNLGTSDDTTISSNGGQTITVNNSGGVLINSQYGPANIFGGMFWNGTSSVPSGAQTIVIDGTGANLLHLVGGTAEARISGGNQSITAGTGSNAGSIILTASTSNFGSANIFTDAGTQTIATTGEINVVAGSAPDNGQGQFNCGGGGACALIGNLANGGDQFITAGQGILIQGGSGGALNEAAVFGNGNQTVNALSIAVIGGSTAGSGNYASLSANASGYAQAVNFGIDGINIQSGVLGHLNNAGIYSGGNQIISGTGDITLTGGVPGVQSWGEISTYAGNGTAAIQSITARSISISAISGPTSTGIFTPTGTQQISTTGSASNGYGITITNSGSTGTDQNGFNSAAYIATRADSQSIEVANSNGILISGTGGEAGIYSNLGSQTVNIHGTGQNKLVMAGGLGQVQLLADGVQNVTAGATGEAGGIEVSGGSVAGAHGWFNTNGNQIINTSGDIVLTGGNGNRTFIFGNNSGSASGVQEITAKSISITAVSGVESTGIFTPAGAQHIHTTGTAGNGYGITIENLGATGVDAGGFGTAAFLTTRTGTQLIDVDQGGILIKATGGAAVIDGEGAWQTINIASGALNLQAGTGAASVYFATGTSQSITADSISLVGGSQNGAVAIIHTDNGTQTITTNSGLLSLKGGTAPGSPTATPDLPPDDCGATSGCAVVISRNGLQTIDAYGIEIIGGGGVSENLATIRGDAGQLFNIGAGGLTMKGGNGSGVHNYAFIENFGGDQILNFASGSVLDITGGDVGVRNFSGIFAGGPISYEYTVLGNTPFAEVFTRTTTGTANQNILGNPAITIAGGATGGGGDGLEAQLHSRGNTGFIIAQTGTQQIDAASIAMTAGGGAGENLVTLATFASGALQTINATGVISLTGGSAAFADADITSAGSQTIHAGGLTLTGGSAINDAYAEIFSNGVQSIVLAGTGASLYLTGGTSGTGNYASISNIAGHDQTLDFQGTGAALTLTGGASGTGNEARIESGRNQTITGGVAISLAGGNGAGAEAALSAKAGAQSIGSSGTPVASLQLSGGGGLDSFATMTGLTQDIWVAGATTLTGGGGNGALAGIGSDEMNAAVVLHTGTLALSAGAGGAGVENPVGAIAAIGAIDDYDANVNVQATGNITLTPSGANRAQIGSDEAGGTVVVASASGSILAGGNTLIRGDTISLAGGTDVTLGTVIAQNGAAGISSGGNLDLQTASISATGNIDLQAATQVKVASTTSFDPGTGLVNLTTPILFLATDFTLPTSGLQFAFLTPDMNFLGATVATKLTNLGTLTLNGNGIGAVFDNQGTLNVASGSVVLSNGGGGSYSVASGAALGFASGSYTVASITGPGGVDVSGGNVNVTDYAVGGVTNLTAGSLAIASTGTLGTLNVNGGSLAGAGNVSASVLNLNGGSLNGTGNLTVSSNFTQSGGTVGGSYQTLSLQHIGDFAVGNYTAQNNLVLTAAGGSLLVNGVSLDAPNVSLAGANIYLQPPADSSSLVDSVNLNVSTPGTLLIDGTNGSSKLLASGAISISAGSVTVKAGNYSASIDPATLILNVAGDLVLQGGTNSSASATVAADSLAVTASNIIIQGGSGDGSYAGIVGGTGSSSVTALNSISLSPGTGLDADAVVGSTGAAMTLTAANCVGCTVLAADPIGNQAIDGGLFGTPVNLIVPNGLPIIEVDNSIIYAATLAESGGSANTNYSDDEEDKDKKDGKESVKEEGKNGSKPKRNLPICM